MLAVTANESVGYITEATANQSKGELAATRKSGRLRSHSSEETTLNLNMVYYKPQG